MARANDEKSDPALQEVQPLHLESELPDAYSPQSPWAAAYRIGTEKCPSSGAQRKTITCCCGFRLNKRKRPVFDMTAFASELPSSLRQRMNDDREIFMFTSWSRTNSADSVGQSLDFDMTYSKQSSQFFMALEDSALSAAIEEYAAVQPRDDFWKSFDARDCSWEDVYQELETAKATYDEKGQNIIRGAFRHGAGFTRNLTPMLDGLPQDNGLGLIKGALKAVQRRSNACKRILDSFERIPDTMTKAERLRQVYLEDENLFQLIKKLIDELVKCIPKLIGILLRKTNDSAFKKMRKTIFEDAVAEVDELLRPLAQAEARLDECRRELDTRGIAENTRRAARTQSGVESLRRDVKALRKSHQDLHELFELKFNALFAMTQDGYRDRGGVGVGVGVGAGPFLNLHCAQVIGAFYESSSASADERPTTPRVSRNQLLRILCGGEEERAHARDLEGVFRKVHDFGGRALAQANYFVATAPFREWLTQADSDVLLLDGHCDEHSVGKVSALSVSCAGLIRTLFSLAGDESVWVPGRPDVVLSFFCGLHTSARDGLSGPLGMLRGLIVQLLTTWPDGHPLDLRFVEEPGVWDGISDWNVGFLCDLFESLVSQLRSRYSVYCIIDGISAFETSISGWNREVIQIVGCFLRCAAVPGQAPVKLLLSSPEKSTTVANYFGRSIPRHIDLRAGNFHSQSFNSAFSDVRDSVHNTPTREKDKPVLDRSTASEPHLSPEMIQRNRFGGVARQASAQSLPCGPSKRESITEEDRMSIDSPQRQRVSSDVQRHSTVA